MVIGGDYGMNPQQVIVGGNIYRAQFILSDVSDLLAKRRANLHSSIAASVGSRLVEGLTISKFGRDCSQPMKAAAAMYATNCHWTWLIGGRLFALLKSSATG
jgi:hypothetical protein